MRISIKALLSFILFFGSVAYAADTASILPLAKTTFLDQNGKPLSSGKVYFYIPATTILKTTWQDSAETIANTNPVILDSAGRAIILGSGSYRQVVKDKNDNQIWDQVTSNAGSGAGGITVGDGIAVGTVLPWTGFVAPTNYAFTYGQELSRTTYATLLTALTITQNITCVGGSPTITTVADTSQLNIGGVVEASCLPAGSVILSKTSSTVTLTANATIGTTVSATFFPFGNGNGITTFNAPDFRGVVLPGRCNMGGSSCSAISNPTYNDPNALNGSGGSQTTTLVTANLPPQTPSGTINGGTTFDHSVANSTAATGANIAVIDANTVTRPTFSFAGTSMAGQISTPIRTVQPSKTVNYIIKIASDVNLSIARCANLTDAGTACTTNVGTSGATLGLLNTANTYSALQSFSTVAISGGSITGMPTPTNPTDVAIKSYVDSFVSGLNFLASSTLATAAVLPNTPTYANGALGVGATLTAGSNTTLTVDGTAAPLNTVVLVKNQVSTFQNGIYTVTTAGSGGTPWVLTRATYFDQAAEMKVGSYTFINSGTVNSGSSYILQSTVTTVGTDPLNFILFTALNSIGAVTGPVTTVVGDVAVWNNTTGTKLADVSTVLLAPNAINLYVSTTGNDSNNCLAIGTPCLTIQHAYSLITGYNLQGVSIKINLAAGTYTKGINISGTLIGNAPSAGGSAPMVKIIGAGSGSTTIDPTTNCGTGANSIVVLDSAIVGIGSVNLQTSCTGGNDLLVATGGSVFLADGDVVFSAATNALIFVTGYSRFDANYGGAFGFKIAGSAAFAIAGSTHATIVTGSGITNVIAGTPGFSSCVVSLIDHSFYNEGIGATWTNPANATGTRYCAAQLSGLDREQNAGNLPGSSAGTLQGGSWYYQNNAGTSDLPCIGGTGGCRSVTSPTGLGTGGVASMAAGSGDHSGNIQIALGTSALTSGSVVISPKSILTGDYGGAGSCTVSANNGINGWPSDFRLQSFFDFNGLHVRWDGTMVSGNTYNINYVCN